METAYGTTHRGGFQLEVVPCGVSTDIYRPRDRSEVRRQLEIPQNRIVLLFTGRLDPVSKMDPNVLLLVLKRLVARHPHRLLLVLAGAAGPAVRDLQATVRQMGLAAHVVHRANLPYVSIPLYYSAADIFVSFSDTLQENFGLTPVEAMASGLPVVVSDWAGYRETVIHGETGFRVPTAWADCDEDLCLLAPFFDWWEDHFYTAQSVAVDVEAATAYLDLLIRDPGTRKRMGDQARKHVLANFSSQRCAEQLWAMWRELSQIAGRLGPTPPERYELLRPRYFQDFQGFASHCLDGAETLELTGDGHLACAGKDALRLIYEARQLLRAELLLRILRAIRTWGYARQQIPLRQLEALLGRGNIPPQVTRRHVMWLLKHGLIRASNPSSPAAANDATRDGGQTPG